MEDRELLELAAKAAGVWAGALLTPTKAGRVWNPLTDDGDALRLAVKLGIDVFPWCDKHRDQADLYAATRRRITRAAAEIGRAMP